MKIIQAIIVIFAIVGCLALALGGYFIYNMSTSGGDNLLTKIQDMRSENPAEEETTATVAATPAPSSQYASIIQQYQPTPTPTPVSQPGTAPVAGAPGNVAAVQPAAAPAARTPRPINTPGPDEGKIRNWPSGRKWVALTYDDGPHPEWTPKMIELLRSKNVKATFYLLGQEIKRFPDIAREIHENGFELGNHTMNHPNFNQSKWNSENITEQLQDTNDLIAEYAGVNKVLTMRPPYGNTPKKLEAVCKDLGLAIIAWDVDTNDWESGVTADDMVENIMKNLKDGSIILMHDKHKKTYDTTEAVIDKIRAEGYEFVTVSELLGLTPHTAPGPNPPAPTATPYVAPAAIAPPAGVAPGAAPAAPAGQSPAAATLPPATTDANSLPAPSAATQAPSASALDESKITTLPPQR